MLAGLSPDQAQHSMRNSRAGALPASDQAPGAAVQPNPTQTTPTWLHLSRRQPEPSRPPGRGHNTERSCDAARGRRTSTGRKHPAPGPRGHPAHHELTASPMLGAARPTAHAGAGVTTWGAQPQPGQSGVQKAHTIPCEASLYPFILTTPLPSSLFTALHNVMVKVMKFGGYTTIMEGGP